MSTFNQLGMLLPEDIHPLVDNIDPTDGSSADITPASSPNCPSGTTDEGTTVVLFDDGDYFEGGSANPEFPVCVLDQDILADTTLTNDHVYVLDGEVFVGTGDAEDATPPSPGNEVVLTIESGVQIYADQGSASAIRVTRGAQIDAQGTMEQPIIMGAVPVAGFAREIDGDPTDLTGRGDWGGLVLNGYARTNSTEDAGNIPNELTSEATNRNVFFGGNDDGDSSGTVSYVIIAESGVAFAPDAEVQGLTLEGVGSGTTINNIQVIGSNDDGIEWFGGAVNQSNILINGAEDDGLDIDLGFRGTIKNFIVRQANGLGDHGTESDNDGDNFGAMPVSRPVLANGLFLIWGDGESGGALLREGYGANFENVVIADGATLMGAPSAAVAGTSCIDNDDEVDEDLNAFGLAYFCSVGAAEPDGDTFEEDWFAGMAQDGSTVTFEGMEDDTISVDPASYQVTTAVSPSSAVSEADSYMGPVSSADAQAQTEWWRGWTVHFGQ
ncbi:hypothetical protein [Spectribacter hydrogenoxidans]|uniref:T5SS/PEP-CTERM-associated repeat-containing protein n=1 Tax=Spectribacter hydrogenoxidans TaxID=3075608 RepID=A0ABU3BYG3_9GAMM|nr:hypothetical protein [Salinisphaera sp. W335]MDT0634350.1 hypothetical protein [Salinisphaera sp. W335]